MDAANFWFALRTIRLAETKRNRLVFLWRFHVMKRKLLLFWVAACVLALPLSSFGQAVSGTLLGTVQDSTGATVANAKVTATNTATATVYESATNDAGNYTIPNLPPGTYSVTVVAQGFKKETHANVDVLINSSTRVDVSVSPGSVSEEVMVT